MAEDVISEKTIKKFCQFELHIFKNQSGQNCQLLKYVNTFYALSENQFFGLNYCHSKPGIEKRL